MQGSVITKWLLVGVAMAGALRAFAGCSGSESSSDGSDPNGAEPTVVRSELARNEQPEVSSEDQSTLASDNAAFACALYAEVRADPGNLVASPHSISTALAMTYAGAHGITAEGMATALHYTLPQERLHAAFNRLDLDLAARFDGVTLENGDPAVLRIANSLWAAEQLVVHSDFLDVLAVNYGAGVGILDFATDFDGAREVINGWADEQTEHRIPELLPDGALDEYTKLLLVNAIYLHAPWAHPFGANQTFPDTFRVDDGTEVTVDMMHQTEQLSYLAADGFQAVRLPYAGGNVSMWILLPDTGRFSEFEAGFDPSRLEMVGEGLETVLVSLTLPKFHVLTELTLKEDLSELGMGVAFTDDADFSAMCANRLKIDDVYHDADIRVDEAGTEAAAATAVVMVDAGVAPMDEDPVEVTVDRPFVFVLRDEPTGAILFMGRVTDPSQ